MHFRKGFTLATIAILILCSSVETRSAALPQARARAETVGGSAYLVQDILPGKSGTINLPLYFTQVGGTVFFAFHDGQNGKELWKMAESGSQVSMVQDIAPGGISSSPSWLMDVNGTLFFTATDGNYGTELWKSDGTSVGTSMVKDIYKGASGSAPTCLFNANGVLYFIADDGKHGNELWRSDGTAAGTRMVKDIHPGPADAFYSTGIFHPFFFVVNTTLYFIANDGEHGFELWKSNGTTAGTTLVKDICPGASSSFAFVREGFYPSQSPFLMALGNVLVFAADDGVHGNELWRSNGKAAGTFLLKDLKSGQESPFISTMLPPAITLNGRFFFMSQFGTSPGLWKTGGTSSGTVRLTETGDLEFAEFLTLVEQTLFFAFNNFAGDQDEVRLWKSDGTKKGSVLVKSISCDFTVNSAEVLGNVDGTLFFVIAGYRSCQLWRSDGTDAGTMMLKDFSWDSAEYDNWWWAGSVALNGELFFPAYDSGHGFELWKSDGTPGGTGLVKDLRAGAGSSSPKDLKGLNGTLVFTADDGKHGREPWKTNGSESGTIMLKDTLPGDEESFISYQIDLDETLVFLTSFAGSDYRGLWRTDGTPSGTLLVKDLTHAADSWPQYLLPVDGKIFFRACSAVSGCGFWVSDGSDNGTMPVCDNGSWPVHLIAANGLAFFSAGGGLWKSDGTPQGTVMVKALEPSYLTSLGDEVFFFADDGVHGKELWRTDGTEAGTHLVKDIRPGGTASSPYSAIPTSYPFLQNVGGTLFFAATDGTHGYELWKSDGTESGTVMVKDLCAGAASGMYLSSTSSYAAMDHTLFFVARDAQHGYELWKSDGTQNGTVMVKDIFPGSCDADSYCLVPTRLTNINGTLFFAGNDGVYGRELWKSDGTEAGTGMVKDIFTGFGGSQPASFVEVNGNLLFSAMDAKHGRELWRSDGTPAGTVIVKDIIPGKNGSFPDSLFDLSGTLVFSAYRKETGTEFWLSDGTSSGTRLFQDIAPGPKNTTPQWFTATNKLLFFQANDGETGVELWALPLAEGSRSPTHGIRPAAPAGMDRGSALPDQRRSQTK